MNDIREQLPQWENRFGSSDPVARAAAARCLGDIATLSFATEPHPFFPSISNQIITAFRLEQRDEVRVVLRETLERLLLFAARNHQNHLVRAANDLADANRAAKKTVLVALAEWAVSRHLQSRGILSSEEIERLAALSCFCPDPGLTVDALHALMREGSVLEDVTAAEQGGIYFEQRMTGFARRVLMSDVSERTRSDISRLSDLETALHRLRESRDVLALALRHLLRPPQFPEPLSDVPHLLYTALETWKRPQELMLAGCFLAGANLYEARLPGVNLDGAYLQGAELTRACLTLASLQRTHLKQANLPKAQMQRADLTGAKAQGARLAEARLQYAQLSNALLQETYLRGAQLQGADFTGAQLQKAYLYRVVLETERDGKTIRARFSDSNLQGIVLTDLLSGDTDTAVLKWFRTHLGLI